MSLTATGISAQLGTRIVLKDFTTSIAPGDFVAVVGANGAGKSTVLKTLSGLLKPVAGTVSLDDADVASIKRRAFARLLAYLPQDRTVHWPLTVERVVALGRLPHRSFAAAENGADHSAIRIAMERMDVMQFAQRPIVALSGGEKARVLIARALAQEARYLVADEPTAGLDPAHSLTVFQEFARLATEGHAVITALHDLSLAARYSNRVILLKDGVCIADGSASSVLTKERLAQAFGIEAIVTTISGIPVILPAAPLT